MKSWKTILFALLLSGSALAAPVELDKVAVIVNNGVILQSDIDTAMKTLRANAKQNGQALPSAEVLHEQIVEKLILDTLQTQEADRIGVRIDDNRLNQAISEIAANNQQTVAELSASITSEGLSYAEFREQIRKEIAASEARNALVRRRINILPAEVDSLSEMLAQETSATVQYKLGHIQLRFSDDQDKAAVEAQAKAIIEKLNNGADFSTMAYTYSKGPKALQGGDWGWMRKEEMPTIFADQIKMQNKGSVIGPFRSGVGFHILKIEDIKGLETIAVTEVNARHILLKPTVILSDEGAKRELNEFIRRIKAGEASFAELAQQYSQDPGSAAQNGELGYQTPDLYVPEFKHQVETLPVGKISEPFQTVHGWHIVEVLDRREVDRTDSAMKNKAYRILFNRKFNEEAGAWMQELRAGAFVEIVKDEEHDS
ncbi:peptidylprolyl isomerase SurA [Vibrio navarrensis]|uniref:Chaperone SurA n=1 Tax=Vibrio navarrensis TaxID=29495 RepID=A0AAJ4IC79_9VIBR|nr:MULTISPECIES: peptidylprolyl isomerase SurA [Vibrio]KJR31844.1 peptidylprolyl isomerase [Vibrio sp. S234-5]MBE3651682.1 peptidylprolyl isomerase SurA [Vibrio navarrensis]MBE3658114.1 peptidylprolyl isomerase SurA [Vibrio navarrensis]MBE3662689.1 peptidylprolyl isomerase SurA [Vibrio navarrensis]MBE4594188.1 peptidylprolyl isomerase SurA [Vibrio navarrensis]